MTAVEELTVVLEHDIDEQYQYQPGELMRGHVRIKVARPTGIRTVTLRVVGEGNVSWKEEEDATIHQAEERYLDDSTTVLDTQQGQPYNLQPGYSEFSFQYHLPDNLPSSYIGKFGNVTYTLKATVTGVKSIDTSITSEPFLVLRRSPLPELAVQPLTLSLDKRLWGACTYGKVSANITLQTRGGVPGEDLFMHAEIKNHSHRTVTAMQASLFMLSSFHARKYTTSFRQIVTKKRDEFDVEHNEGRRWNFVRLPLPPYIPETHLDHCDLIDIQYRFQFRVEVSGGGELKMESPLLVGSHLPGQGSPRREDVASSPAPNQQWSVRGKGFRLEEGDLGGPHNDWGMSSGVPELRSPDRAVMSNPLFQQGSQLTPRLGLGSAGSGDVPEEQMENTRL